MIWTWCNLTKSREVFRTEGKVDCFLGESEHLVSNFGCTLEAVLKFPSVHHVQQGLFT